MQDSLFRLLIAIEAARNPASGTDNLARSRFSSRLKRVWNVLRRWLYTPESGVNVPAYW
jgi:hypothetical protein